MSKDPKAEDFIKTVDTGKIIVAIERKLDEDLTKKRIKRTCRI